VKDAVAFFLFFSVDGSLVSVVDYFVFEYVTPIFVSRWSCDVPVLVEYTPCNLAPTKVREVELNRVIPGGSCGYVYVVAGTSSNGSPPCFSEISCGDVMMSSAFDGVGLEHPMISGSETRHNGSLVLMLRSHCTST